LRRTSQALAQLEKVGMNDGTNSASEAGIVVPESVRRIGDVSASSTTDGANLPGIALQEVNYGDIALDGAENPLQLLANASEHVRVDEAWEMFAGASPNPGASNASTNKTPTLDDIDVDAFFGRVRPRLDITRNLDPIELGLVTVSDAEILFALYVDGLVCVSRSLLTLKF
jgi:hypothetical protein